MNKHEFERACRLLPPDFTWGQPVTPELVLTIEQAARMEALEEAAKAVEDHNRSDREWVRGSLWDALSREAAGRIRALMEKKE